jgi:hypothetical protein
VHVHESLRALDARAVHAWAAAACASLDTHRAEIDRLNVFPVHDSDTGTNLATTLRAGLTALEAALDTTSHHAAPTDAAAALAVLARGTVLGASGNSGNIAAQLLRALADTVAESGRWDAATLRAGLRRGAVEARAAVADPVEGTILTVAAAAADAVAGSADSAATLAEVAAVALVAADEALRRTPEQLDVLARAGVVDAGGQGFVLILEALVLVLGAGSTSIAPVHAPAGLEAVPVEHDRTTGGGAFEVAYLLDIGPAVDADPLSTQLRGALLRLGDSVVVVGSGEGTLSVHVHTDDVGAAVEAGLAGGRPYRIAITPLVEPPGAPKPGAVVAVCPDSGLAAMFAREGVEVVAGAALGAADVVTAVRACAAREVVLLPTDVALAAIAERAAHELRRDGLRVVVIPTRSPVQALAAVAVHDPTRGVDDDVVAMAEAAAATRVAEITVAEHESLTSAGVCQPGDVLGLIDGEVVDIGRGVLAVTLTVVDRLLGIGAELMTVLLGDDAPSGLGELVRRHVRDRTPLTEVTVYEIGLTSGPIVIGVE